MGDLETLTKHEVVYACSDTQQNWEKSNHQGKKNFSITINWKTARACTGLGNVKISVNKREELPHLIARTFNRDLKWLYPSSNDKLVPG